MLNPTQILATALGDHLERAFNGMFGSNSENYAQQAAVAGRIALECIGNSDAPYHDLQHTLHVTAVGLEIMRGKHIHVRTTPEDWVHYTVALLCHDIGYVRGICPGDHGDVAVTDESGNTVEIPAGGTDAFLTPYHVERGKMFVRWRFRDHPVIDPEIIVHNIARTQFPVPDVEDAAETGD